MNSVLFLIKNLSKPKKILILVSIDIYLTFICWLIFGPTLPIVLTVGFDMGLFELISQNYLNYVIPCLLVFIYFYISGFYRPSIRFSDSRDSISRALKGAIIFGTTWGIVYLIQYEVIRNDYLLTVFIKSILLAFAFYGSLQISRDIARLLINSDKEKLVKELEIIAGKIEGDERQIIQSLSKLCMLIDLKRSVTIIK